ncbi:9594_t:CDS:2 [Gigaspora rosea]|nr:9594_t:CDS:2 [Gigaspora rosea]
MSSSKVFHKNVFPTHFLTRRVRFLQLPSFMLRNLKPDLFQSSLSRPYANFSPSPHTSPEETTSSYLNKFTKYIAKRLPTAILTNIIVTGLVAGISSDKFVPRPEIVEHLKRIFNPMKINHFIKCEVEHGVIYIDVPANFNKLGEAFGKAINFTFEESISFTGQLMRKILGETNTNDKLKISEWERAMDAFKRASAVYKTKHNKPPVIIYDNLSRLVHINPEILDILQDDAKDNADDRKYIAVFVSNEGDVPRRISVTRSSWLRAEEPIEIGDLSREESLNYLINKRGIKTVKEGKVDTTEAEKLFDLVGGRIVDLKSIADKYLKRIPIEVIEYKILTKVEDKFRTAKLLETHKHHEVGKRIISVLLVSKELSRIAFEKFFDKPEQAIEILGSNVFAYHPEKNTPLEEPREEPEDPEEEPEDLWEKLDVGTDGPANCSDINGATEPVSVIWSNWSRRDS